MITLREKALFLSEYATELFDSGATCIRMDKNVSRMAEAFGCKAVMTTFPLHINISVFNPDTGECETFVFALRKHAISYDINTQLSQLSWAVGDGKIGFHEAVKEFDRIRNTPPANRWMVLWLASLANGAFCSIFGGDWSAAFIVFLVTAIGFATKYILISAKIDIKIVFTICAFISSVIAALLGSLGWSHTPDIAVATSVLYLVPGIIYLNSFNDLFAGHYLCAFSRFMNAVVLTCCLSLGLCGGLLLMNIGMF